MKVFQGLTLFVGLIVLGHGEDSGAAIDSIAKRKFSERIEFYAGIVRTYVHGDHNLTERLENSLPNNTFEFEDIYNGINEEFSSYSELSSISCIYARDHYKIVSEMLKKLGDLIIVGNPLILIFKNVMRKSVDMCLQNYSPRDYFYDLYNLTVLTEWKGHIMLTKFDDLLNSGKTPECFDENENQTDQDKAYTSLHENRLVIYNKEFMLMMELIKCIPEFHACDEYHDSTKDLGVFKSPSDLNGKIYRQAVLNNWTGHRFNYSLYV